MDLYFQIEWEVERKVDLSIAWPWPLSQTMLCSGTVIKSMNDQLSNKC